MGKARNDGRRWEDSQRSSLKVCVDGRRTLDQNRGATEEKNEGNQIAIDIKVGARYG